METDCQYPGRRAGELGQPGRELQDSLKIPAGARCIVERLRAHGYQALLAGGCVRDGLLGRRPSDWDVATDAAPEVVMELFERTIPVGVQFGIAIVALEDGQYEVARFRQDGPYLDGRRPAEVRFADPQTDARRRDFTINGMFYDPVQGRLLDYVGGCKDLEQGVIRAIGDPAQRFAEDYLRLVRAVRFAARFGFCIEPATLVAMCRQAPRIATISAERLRDELTRILTEGGAGQGMQWLLDTGLLAHLLPEAAAMQGVAQPPQFHPEGDVWRHVKLALEALRRPAPRLAWATLLHDIGKPLTYEERDRIRFDNHDAVGAELAEKVCRRLRMANDDTARIRLLVADHMRLRHVRQMRPGKLKRLLRAPHFAELLELHRADCLASHGDLELYAFCREQLEAMEPEELRPARLLSGDELKEMGFVPGPLLGKILAAVEEEQLEGRLKSKAAAERFVRERFGG